MSLWHVAEWLPLMVAALANLTYGDASFLASHTRAWSLTLLSCAGHALPS